MSRVVVGLKAFPRPPVRAVVTIGMFDGVHLAHQRLIRATCAMARRMQGTSVVITFDPDPQLVLDPAKAQPALMPLDARVAHLCALGVDAIWVIPFTRRFSQLTAQQFITRILVNRLRAMALVVGENFMFGQDRHGDLTLLRRLGAQVRLQVRSIPSVRREGNVVSSSRIRRLIGAGQLAHARRLLGRAPALYGTVVRGAGRGHRLGFPTANIRVMPQQLPPQGVYAVLVQFGASPRARTGTPWRGVMNLGVRPTFGRGPLVCEVHLLGFSGTLRGRLAIVSLRARLRGERCFPTPDALQRQVKRDVRRAQRLLAH